MRVVGELVTGENAVGTVKALRPHFVLIDLAVPDLSGLQAARNLKHSFPHIGVALLTEYDPEHYTALAELIGLEAVIQKDYLINDIPKLLKRIQKKRRQ